MLVDINAVAGLDAGDLVARLDDGADELVADREPGLHLHAPVIDVEVRAADAAGLDRDHRVVAGLELRLRPFVDLHFVGGLEGDCSHW